MWHRLLTKAALLIAVFGAIADGGEPRPSKSDNNQTLAVTTDNKSKLASEMSPADGAAPANALYGRNPRVLVITDKESKSSRRELERLRAPGGEFAGMLAKGWKIGPEPQNHVQIVDRDQVPELLKQLDASEFPIVACISDGEIIRSFKDGCSTPLDAWTFGWLLKGINERPQAPIPEAIRVATTGRYPLRGNHWTVDGDSNPSRETLVAHLRSATHVNYLAASWKIEDWSTEELRSLHDDLHEKYGPAGPSTGSSSAPSGTNSFSGNRKALGKF